MNQAIRRSTQELLPSDRNRLRCYAHAGTLHGAEFRQKRGAEGHLLGRLGLGKYSKESTRREAHRGARISKYGDLHGLIRGGVLSLHCMSCVSYKRDACDACDGARH